MVILPIIGATAAAGLGFVCWRGVKMAEGQIGNVKWRVKFACWRYIADIEIDGKWTRLGTYKFSEHEQALESAKAQAALLAVPTPGGPGMIRLTRARMF